MLAFAVRRRSLTRLPGSFECSVRHAGHWSLGIARFGRAEASWWRVFSFAPRARWVWQRADLEVLERRRPAGLEVAVLAPGSVVVRCTHDGRPLDLAMSQDAYTGFASWLESAPPGPAVTVT